MGIIWWIVVTGLLFVFIFILLKVLKTTTRMVGQDERLVIYRLGHFQRIVGPGPVQIIPKLDQVVRTINLRARPIGITVSNVFVFGVQNELRLDLWCNFDLVQAAGGDREKLVYSVQISELERRQQVELKMREVLLRQIEILQDRMPLPDKATPADRIEALTPGHTRYNTLLKGVKYELEKSLLEVGVVLNTTKPIVLTRTILDKITAETVVEKPSAPSKTDQQALPKASQLLTRDDLSVLKRIPPSNHS